MRACDRGRASTWKCKRNKHIVSFSPSKLAHHQCHLASPCVYVKRSSRILTLYRSCDTSCEYILRNTQRDLTGEIEGTKDTFVVRLHETLYRNIHSAVPLAIIIIIIIVIAICAILVRFDRGGVVGRSEIHTLRSNCFRLLCYDDK